MTKGHNQSKHKQSNPLPDDSPKQSSQHRKDADKDKSPNQGRNENSDQSGGRKGQNNV